ncbi:hypothetical protein GWN26_08400, partial [Candidatus Saccharibacteria bacterium]|nr:hypothetical protein [Candidatus Saccharibacteria bacterium]NIV99152.1 hypothetical protein [Candidatus Saccharibacteria bacterium]
MSKKSNRKKTSKKRQAMSSASNKRPIIILAAILVAVGSYFFYFKGDRNPYAYRPDKAPLDIEALKGGETRSTLSPVSFVGNVARAYNVARENRELLDSIHCYCNCKKTIGHKSLLSCFTDKHAVDCKICQDQAFYAESRFKEGNDIAQVRLAVDKK